MESEKRGSSLIYSNIEKLNEALEGRPLPNDIGELLDECSLNLRFLNSFPFGPKRFLGNLKQLLLDNSTEVTLNYDMILEILQHLIKITDFDSVLEIFTIQDLENALTSNSRPLIISALKVVSSSYPKGIIASTQLLDIILQLYFDETTHVSIVHEIEVVFKSLSSDALIRRRILENNLPLLIFVKDKFELITMTRLLELLTITFDYVSREEFNKKLFIINPDEIQRSLEIDIMMFINITTYCNSILDASCVGDIAMVSKIWIIKYLIPVFASYGDIYSNLDEYPEVNMFALTYIFKFFRTISISNYENIFEVLDKNYLKIGNTNRHIIDFMSFTNPSYLLEHHNNLVTEYSIMTPSKLGVLRNVIADEACFEYIKTQITDIAVLRMPYIEQMVLLERLSQFSYCVKYLVGPLSNVMSSIVNIDNLRITETETVDLRRKVLSNLVDLHSAILGKWYTPLLSELRGVGQNSKGIESQTEVTSMYL